ncbi:hypothetical protein TNCT_60671 [Trichonephila clavata]|uniref:Uncharacterized protein n=1 Tax=Trichonephila clavata TaxID=2740835 RepID=A0A8X6G758_TRICU|nr:hypothetical protein TNCT_60671 [Trichonephila clavata]
MLNKMVGDYIKIQPASSDDHRAITNLLEEKKAEYYVIQPLANRPIKVVIKMLPTSTDVADIKSDHKEKVIDVEKVVQLHKFTSKAPCQFSWLKFGAPMTR